MRDSTDAATPTTAFPAAPSLARRKRVLLVFLIALVPFAWLTVRFNWLCDDAFISFRYSKHLAEGHGLRYNVGEDPPVEGYTNFLWVLVLTPLEAMGWATPVWARVLSAACGVVLVWRVTRFLALGLDLPWLGLIASALFFATLPPVAVWSTSGLATLPNALLFFLVFEFLLGTTRPRGLAGGMACVLLILIRADGFVWVAGLIGLTALEALLRRDRTAIKPLVLCTVISAVALGGLIGFRLAYFGWAMPNTFYAKVGFNATIFERGWKYLVSFLLALPHLPLAVVAGVAVVWRRGSDWPVARQVALIALGTFGYAVIVGGDFMAMWRLFVPTMPFVAILFGVAIRRLCARPVAVLGCAVSAVVLSLLPAYNLHVVPAGVREKVGFRWGLLGFVNEYVQWELMAGRSQQWSQLGRVLDKHTQPGESLVWGSIGALGYYSHLFIYDINGLVSVEVAHRPAPRQRRLAGHDKNVRPVYFLKYGPTYYAALIGDARYELPPREDGRGYLLREIPEIIRDIVPFEVRERYAPVAFPLDPNGETGPGKLLLMLKRKDLAYEGR